MPTDNEFEYKDNYEEFWATIKSRRRIENTELTTMLDSLELELKLKEPNYISIIIIAGTILRQFLYYNSMPEGDRTILIYDRIIARCREALKI